ncbi:MAG: bacterio-opsin activator domain-containing protein [Halobacteriaceae archaeon]
MDREDGRRPVGGRRPDATGRSAGGADTPRRADGGPDGDGGPQRPGSDAPSLPATGSASVPDPPAHVAGERERAVERTTEGVYTVDEEFRVTFVNAATLDILGLPAGELLGEVVWEAIPQVEGTIGQRMLRQVQETREPVAYEQTDEESGRTYAVRIYPSGDGLAVYFREVTERKERTRELERLQRLHAVVTDLNEAIGGATSRAQIESVVCERLAGEGPGEFGFVWLGREREGGVEAVAAAGDDRHREALETCSTTLAAGPPGTALDRGEIVIARPGDDALDPWRGTPLADDSTVVAAVPLGTGPTRSVLVLHATSTETPLSAAESETALSQLRDAITLAVGSARSRAALVSDAAVEAEFAVRDDGDSLIGATADLPGRLTVGRTTVRGDGSYHSVVAASADAPAAVERFRSTPGVRSVTDPTDDGRFEFTVEPTADAALTVLAAHGGDVERLEVEAGVATVRASFPATADVRSAHDALADTFDSVDLQAKRDRTRAAEPSTPDPTEDLTDRQAEVLATAVDEGYFAWPREHDAEDVAATLGVSSATFHEHLRTAQRKVFEAVLGR